MRLQLVKIVSRRFKIHFYNALTTNVIPTCNPPFYHPIYYAQTLRTGRIVDIWSDFALAVLLVIGIIGRLILLQNPLNIVSLLFAVRAAVHGEIQIWETDHFVSNYLLLSNSTQFSE